MKKILLILLCSVSFASAQQTLFRVDCDDGNDSNDGTSWPGYLTVGAVHSDIDFTEGDTLVSTGTCTETFSPFDDGATNNKMFWMDSLVFADGWDPTSIDTSKVWSTILDGTASVAGGFSNGGDNFWTVIGIDFKDFTLYNIALAATDTKVTHCRSRDHGDGVGALVNIQGTRDSLITNLFLADTPVQFAIWVVNSANGNVVVNNTMYGDFTLYNRLDGTGTVTKWQNNLIQSTSTGSGDNVIRLDGGSTGIIAGVWDNNLYWEATAITNSWHFNGASFDLLATWVDSVDNYLSGAEANALDADPLLQNVATTCSITDSSPAFEAGTDLGFGDDIGYFQLPASASRRIFLIGKADKKQHFFELSELKLEVPQRAKLSN